MKGLYYSGKPVKFLTVKLKKTGGRNNSGLTTVWHRGGGSSKFLRRVDFSRSQFNVPAIIRRIEADRSRNCMFALICYRNGSLSYILSTSGLRVGDLVVNWDVNISFDETSDINKFFLKRGNSLSLLNYPIGSIFHSVNGFSKAEAKLSRAAGTSSKLLKRYKKFSLIKLPSSEIRMVCSKTRAVSGSVSTSDLIFENSVLKAGKVRNLGWRPVVRGVAMNPVDHPHGGDTSGGRCSSSPWGKLTKGKPTRSPNKINKFIIKRRKSK